MNWRRYIAPVPIAGAFLTFLLIAMGYSQARLVRDLGHSVYGMLVRNHLKPLQTEQILIVDIDEASLREVGQWPWSRFILAKLTDRILESGAKVLVFDMVFAEPDRSSPALLDKELERHFGVTVPVDRVPEDLRDFDAIFAKSLSGHATVLGCFLHRDRMENATAEDKDPGYRGRFYWKGTGDFQRRLATARDLTMSIPVLRDAAAGNAFFNTIPDDDNVVRSTPLVWSYGAQRIYPALALEAARIYLGVSQIGIEYDEDGITGLRLDERFVPTDGRGRLVLNYRQVEGRRGSLYKTFPQVPAADVLAGRCDADLFQGKMVFVGTSAAGLQDLRATPVVKDFPGVEIQATAAENILSNAYLKQPASLRIFDTMATLIAGLMVTAFASRGRSWLSFLLTAGLLVAVVTTSVALFTMSGIVFVPTGLISVVIVVYPVLNVLRFWQQERRTRWLRRTFGAMVSEKVLTFLEADPKGASMQGHKTETTILFSDIQGFTSISEELDPEALSDLMNIYLSCMEGIIRRHDGYVDKFVGDAIMAEWGVPYFFPHHAEQACKAALAMVDALAEIQKDIVARCGREIKIRIGINTGTVTAGNMGSEERFNFTVMGDTVNLASRLEKLNKQYGTTIIVSEFTRALVADRYNFRLLDRVVVAGKTKAVEVYELLPPAGP